MWVNFQFKQIGDFHFIVHIGHIKLLQINNFQFCHELVIKILRNSCFRTLFEHQADKARTIRTVDPTTIRKYPLADDATHSTMMQPT